jgi:predicted transcriptional regulator
VINDPLTPEVVGALLGISPKTVVRYVNESKPGKRYEKHPFPEPDERGRGVMRWAVARIKEIEDP